MPDEQPFISPQELEELSALLAHLNDDEVHQLTFEIDIFDCNGAVLGRVVFEPTMEAYGFRAAGLVFAAEEVEADA